MNKKIFLLIVAAIILTACFAESAEELPRKTYLKNIHLIEINWCLWPPVNETIQIETGSDLAITVDHS
ncbi:MAG: hypothetical protein ACOYK6_05840 [Chthoniobacterales bacterium]